MDSIEIRKRFLEYFKEHGHTVVPSSSLLPDDPSVLLTTAGMQQFKKYYTGEADALRDFGSKSTVSIQKCFRTSCIDEVGDVSHLTLFEMLGSFSFGGYFKKEAITYAFEFITKVMELPISYVTIFQGSDVVPRDEESADIWESLGVTDIREEGIEDVFWGPTGSNGPCGPSTEIYCRNAQGNDIEIWNTVFNQYVCSGSREALLGGEATLSELPIFGIDTGMGLERLAMIAQNTRSIYETDLFSPMITLLPEAINVRLKRIIADHARGCAFLISDGVRPSNKERGYILRRLLRRIIVHEYLMQDTSPFQLADLFAIVVEHYGTFYPELSKEIIVDEFQIEKEKFLKTLKHGLKELEKIAVVDAQSAFKLYESYGLPYEIVKEISGEKSLALTHEAFDEEFRKHQEISRAGLEKKFGGHGLLLDTGELKASNEEELKKVTRLHTATHLLQQALRMVLGPDVSQKGSDITVERTRFDFSFSRKMTDEEIRRVEDIVNDVIGKDIPITFVALPKDEAVKTGALYHFKEKYPDSVKVYYVGDSIENAFSKEFCGGPHVTRTGEIGSFKIVKEEACSAGVRRIRAVLSM